jgi:hypothetical protein
VFVFAAAPFFLQEASRLSRIVADDAMRITHQRRLIEHPKPGAEATELEQVEVLLKLMLDEQTHHEQHLVRVQAKLIF